MARRKSFTGEGSPARQFFSEVEADGVPETVGGEPKAEEQTRTEPEPAVSVAMGAGAKEEVPVGYKRNPEYIECRTKRVQLVMQPSLYEAAKAMAAETGVSMNEFFNRAVATAVGRQDV